MEFSENFHTRCTKEEAFNISKHLTVDVNATIIECYVNAFENVNNDDINWKMHCALAAVYMLGFISGARAIRERQKEKRQALRFFTHSFRSP